MMRFKPLVLVAGAGEMGTAVVHRLNHARFRVVLATRDDPHTLIRGNAYSRAAFTGTFEVEGVPVQKAVVTEAVGLIDKNIIPLLTAELRSVIDVLNPEIVVDARFSPSGREVTVGDASLVIGIGQGFEAGVDCDLAVQDAPGHDLGRIIYRGPVPRAAKARDGKGNRHLVRAGRSGVFTPLSRIGQSIKAGEDLAHVGESTVPSPSKGVVSGLLMDGVQVTEETLIAEIDEEGLEEQCYTLSVSARNVSGSVLEAVVAWAADVGGFPYP
jgi:xanthine dehydrogenase accessory factor